jgi:hypothetical protein
MDFGGGKRLGDDGAGGERRATADTCGGNGTERTRSMTVIGFLNSL